MTRLLLLLAAVLGNGPSATAYTTPATADTAGILRLMGRSGVAHACPVSAVLAYTNAHVVIDDEDKTDSRQPYVWSAMDVTGLLRPVEADRYRDLAKVVPADGAKFPRWYPVAKQEPKPGDRVVMIGFEFRNKKQAFAERVFAARVIRVVAGHLIYEPAGVPGTSGSCVLLEATGELVAINKGAKGVGHADELVGVGVGAWGSLLQLGEEPQ